MAGRYSRPQFGSYRESKLPRLGCLLIVVAALALVAGCIAVIAIVGQQEQEREREDGQKVERIVKAVPGAVAEAEGTRIALNEILDPWVPQESFLRPETGRRFVAFDVTIENVGGGSPFVSCFDFRLSDTEDFAYEAELLASPEPDLRGVELAKGQKTRGWCAFEVNEGTPLKLLKYDPNPFTTNDIEFHWE